MNTTLAEAVRRHSILSFQYEELPRIVEPHLYGLHVKTNNETLLAYQVGGSSHSSARLGWRNFVVSEIRDLHLTMEAFGPTRPNYDPHDRGFRIVFARA